MKQYNSTFFRKNMTGIFNTCYLTDDPVLITTRKDGRDEPQQMVIISKELYDMSNVAECTKELNNGN